jgi:carboxypeptidase Q
VWITVYKTNCGKCSRGEGPMKSFSIIRLAALSALFPLALLAYGQGDPDTLTRIADQGKNHSQIVDRLHYLCFDIGARLTSSPELLKAQKWALREFKKFGCTNVHLEKWGEFPVGFDRGPEQVCRMVEPFESDMVFTTPCWANGTKGLERGEAFLMPETLDEIKAHAADIKGKWVIAPPGRVATAEVTAELERDGALGRISGSRNELVVTSGPAWRTVSFEKHPGLPLITVRKSDFDRITRNINFKRKVVLEINADNRWYKGPIPCYNVIADIKGTEKPDEMVIVSGHFDSWNGPGSQGAQDNGVGAMTAMEAARILCSAHAKPKRTIRFILWSGEEQGIFGSTNYVKMHKDELDKISAVLVDDGGGNYQGGYRVLTQMKPMMEAAIVKTNETFPDMPEVIQTLTSTRMPRGGGSDHAPFNAVGVPGFFTIETGTLNYTFVHHTQNDRFETIIPAYLVQSGTNHALVSYNLACADALLPREPKPAQ